MKSFSVLIFIHFFTIHTFEATNKIDTDEIIFQGNKALTEHQYHKAITLFTQLIVTHKIHDPKIYFKRATAYFLLNKLLAAITDLKMSIKSDPKYLLGHLYLAKSYHRLGYYDKGIQHYESVIQYDHKNSEALKGKSELEKAKKYYLSIDHLESKNVLMVLGQILAISPFDVNVLLKRSKFLLDEGKYQETLLDSGSVLKIDKNVVDAYYYRGKAYFYLDDFDRSLLHYKEGLKNNPEHKILKTEFKKLKKIIRLTNNAQNDFKKRLYKKSLEKYDELLKIDPFHLPLRSRILFSQCQSFVKVKNGKEAVKSCSGALEIDENMAHAWAERGNAKIILEEFEDAVRDWEKAKKLLPQDREIDSGFRRAQMKLKESKRKDYYKILGVNKSATKKEIKKAYKKLALKWHPDKKKTEEEKKEAEKMFYEIGEANQILTNDDTRRRYDAGEDVTGNSQGGGPSGFNGFHGGFEGFPFDFGDGQTFSFRFN